MSIDTLSVLCGQLTRDLLAIAKFLLFHISVDNTLLQTGLYNLCFRPCSNQALLQINMNMNMSLLDIVAKRLNRYMDRK